MSKLKYINLLNIIFRVILRVMPVNLPMVERKAQQLYELWDQQYRHKIKLLWTNQIFYVEEAQILHSLQVKKYPIII